MLVEQGAYAILMNYMIADGEERRHGECDGCSWCCSYPLIFAPRHLGTLHFANSRCGAGDGAGGKGGVSSGLFGSTLVQHVVARSAPSAVDPGRWRPSYGAMYAMSTRCTIRQSDQDWKGASWVWSREGVKIVRSK